MGSHYFTDRGDILSLQSLICNFNLRAKTQSLYYKYGFELRYVPVKTATYMPKKYTAQVEAIQTRSVQMIAKKQEKTEAKPQHSSLLAALQIPARQPSARLSLGVKRLGFSLLSVMATIMMFSKQTQAEQTLLIMGDSISAGYGLKPDRGWVTLLQDKIQNTDLSQTKVINASVSGETTAGGLSRLPRLLEAHEPTAVIIELGGNDGLRGYPISAMNKNLSKMIELSKASNAKILLVGMQIPPNYGKRYARLFDDSFEKIAAEEDVPLLPFFLDDIVLVPGMMQADGIHPNEKAQAQLLSNIWAQLKALLTSG